jgi:hypothetical protein
MNNTETDTATSKKMEQSIRKTKFLRFVSFKCVLYLSTHNATSTGKVPETTYLLHTLHILRGVYPERSEWVRMTARGLSSFAALRISFGFMGNHQGVSIDEKTCHLNNNIRRS